MGAGEGAGEGVAVELRRIVEEDGRGARGEALGGCKATEASLTCSCRDSVDAAAIEEGGTIGGP